MNKILLALVWILAPVAVFSQFPATLVISSTATKPVTIVEHGGTATTPIFIEIANPNPPTVAHPAIIVDGPQGFIVSENEWNIVKWDAQLAGTDTIPFGYVNGSSFYYLPLIVQIGTAGTGTTPSTLYATWHTIPDQMTGVTSLTGDPTDVTDMGAMDFPGSPSNTDNSYNVVDRFWVLDTYTAFNPAFDYTTKPSLSGISFSYISNGGTPSEVMSNPPLAVFATEKGMIAQRFNTSLGWGDWVGGGSTDNATAGGTTALASTGIAVTPANFYRSWTLTNSIFPLPIQLTSFTAQCDDNNAALIQWTSQTELNNDYYTVSRSSDGIHLETVGTIKAYGTGTADFPQNYQLIDNSPLPGTSYYFLSQTDIDGKVSQIGHVLFSGCGANNVTTINGYNTTNYIEVDINAVAADNFNISLVNMLGQTLINENYGAALGSNELRLDNKFSPGIYILNIRNDNVNYAKKLVLGVK